MKLPIGQIEKSANIIKLQGNLKRKRLFFYLMLSSVFIVIGLMETVFSNYTKPLHSNSITAPVGLVYTGNSTGTAFLSGPTTLLTNRHVVDKINLGDEVGVIFTLASKKIDTKAKVIWKDNVSESEKDLAKFETDFAVLSIINPSDLPEDMPVMALGNSDDINISDEVKAIGYPGSAFSVTEGKISNTMYQALSEKREFDLIQLDCNIFPGNSGGPIVLSKTEEVVGLAVAVGLGDIKGMNFACKINLLLEKVEAEGIDIYK